MSVDLSPYFKSIVDQDKASVVICDINHKIVYMNDAANSRYKEKGGRGIIGQNIFLYHSEKAQKLIKEVVEWFMRSSHNNHIYAYYNKDDNIDVCMSALRNAEGGVVGYCEKHESRNRETVPLYDFLSNNSLI